MLEVTTRYCTKYINLINFYPSAAKSHRKAESTFVVFKPFAHFAPLREKNSPLSDLTRIRPRGRRIFNYVHTASLRDFALSFVGASPATGYPAIPPSPLFP